MLAAQPAAAQGEGEEIPETALEAALPGLIGAAIQVLASPELARPDRSEAGFDAALRAAELAGVDPRYIDATLQLSDLRQVRLRDRALARADRAFRRGDEARGQRELERAQRAEDRRRLANPFDPSLLVPPRRSSRENAFRDEELRRNEELRRDEELRDRSARERALRERGFRERSLRGRSLRDR